jgi:hypothetical protein
MSFVIDCEVKSVHIGAGRTCLCVVVDVYSSFSIRVSVPSVLFTCGDFKRSIVVLGNSEVQSVSAGASVSVRVVIGIYPSRVVGLFMPKVLLACSLGFCIVGAVVDCEVKGVHIGAGRTCLCVVVDVCASFIIRVSVPDVLLACSCLERCIVML